MREIFIDENNKMLRIAVKEDGILKELFFREKCNVYPGQIYIGVIGNVVPGIKCAFVDIGMHKNAYMYIDRKFKNTRLKKGDCILVQVLKEPVGKKGPKVTNAIDISGKYCVLSNFYSGVNFSRKIENSEFKKCVIEKLYVPQDTGIMIRTEAEKVSVESIQNELNMLYNMYKSVIDKGKYSSKKGLVSENGGLLFKVLNEKLQEVPVRIFANTHKSFDAIKNFMEKYEKTENSVVLYEKEVGMFEYYNIEDEILKLRNRKVCLECGGYIVIDKTEAMYTIDVNSGRNTNQNSMEDTVFTTNIQAALEIARQIKLRNLGGIIVIDFIDMHDDKKKENIIKVIKREFSGDKNKTVVYQFTELNLVQIARHRYGREICDYIQEECSFCRGRGNKLKFSYLSMLIEDKIKKIPEENIHIRIGNNYKEDIERNRSCFLEEIYKEGKNIYVTYEDDDYFKVEPVVFSSDIEKLAKFKLN